MKLDLSSFKKAVKSLEQAIEISNKLIKGANTPEEKFFKAGVIQNFEFTYELSWKIIQRCIELYFNPGIEVVTRRDLFRMAFKYNLIEDPKDWYEYQQNRNITSHAYDELKADAVYQIAKIFIEDAKYLLAKLEEVNNEQ
ncbi:MAG: nucleotidyltransferase substrate binding protein [Endomicrobium sp.]|nr:nucleotidyltransferase substrate binding protein [Endomicrobium sp.]